MKVKGTYSLNEDNYDLNISYEVNLKLIPNDGTEDDGDLNDIDIKCVGEIYMGGLDSDIPFVEIGFQENN
jgi:hypothetical protein